MEKTCQICNQEFDQISLEVHVATFHQNDNNKCEICEKVFKSQNIFKKHFRTVHGNKGKIITCNICTKTFQSQMQLNIHVKTVHGICEDYKCESCGKSFSSRLMLMKNNYGSVALLDTSNFYASKC